ncbi:hypothetical protein ACCO45_000995 [Purpureocillium lilacinum]|uniref:Uncharacterized protein n=1 Tax=Purpureocillium lilacinum TaxID=33203 RepID=A0ACC4E5R0_PURLI
MQFRRPGLGILAAWPGIWVAAAHPWTQASRAICLDSRLSSLDAGGGDRRPRACQLRSPAPLDGRSHPPGAETGQARSTTDGLAPASLPFPGSNSPPPRRIPDIVRDLHHQPLSALRLPERWYCSTCEKGVDTSPDVVPSLLNTFAWGHQRTATVTTGVLACLPALVNEAPGVL